MPAEQAGITPLRLPGQYADEETGLHYNWHRYYDPETGVYLSPEPIGLEGDIKPYAYVDNYPMEWVDADGLLRCVIARRNGTQIVRSSGGSEESIHRCSYSGAASNERSTAGRSKTPGRMRRAPSPL
ncbi:RHS repeat-associated core domain-containing protein [Sorangium sp. So ce590]|uniref:RHS repeat-associated core domain-containing protein n=1 Tax=Sorangium sp. So ce590 TaxID=3133317 RepID=UPI003F5E172D